MKKKFKLEDLDCANCAAKMEDAIKKIPGVNDASVSFMTQKMSIDAEDEKFDEIVDFSELGEFIEVPIKNYSSGMKSRLGFSIATVVEPDILILDEVLSVGDKKFRNKSEKKIMSMFDKGVTVLFVSHSLEQVQRLCDRAIILDSGRLVASGSVDKVAKIYKNMTE